MTISALAGTNTSFVMHFTTSIDAPGEPASNVKFAHAKRYTRRCRVGYWRRRADHQRRMERNPSFLAFAPMITAMVAGAEKNTGSSRAFDLAAVVADVDQTRLWIFGEPVRGRSERRAIISRSRDGNREFAQAPFIHKRRSHMNFFVNRGLFNNLRWDWIALRLVPAVDDLFRFTLQPKAVDLSRCSQSSNNNRYVVLPALHVRDIRKHERPPLVLR